MTRTRALYGKTTRKPVHNKAQQPAARTLWPSTGAAPSVASASWPALRASGDTRYLRPGTCSIHGPTRPSKAAPEGVAGGGRSPIRIATSLLNGVEAATATRIELAASFLSLA